MMTTSGLSVIKYFLLHTKATLCDAHWDLVGRSGAKGVGMVMSLFPVCWMGRCNLQSSIERRGDPLNSRYWHDNTENGLSSQGGNGGLDTACMYL